MRRLSAALLFSALLTIPAPIKAQTATTGVISGTVTDTTGAVVPAALLELEQAATGVRQTQNANEAGQYVFSSLTPGLYKVKASKAGFRAAQVPEIRVDVAKAYAQNFQLELGAVAESVDVVAQAGVELQTADATVGNVLAGQSLLRLPTFTRRANELLTVQPGVTPTGEVTGARNDQSTFSVDGIDATNQWGDPGTYVYLGLESVEEFRVGVANPNAAFGRGAGGQVAIIGRRGSNDFHGAGFWYLQNDNLNANTWTNNRTGLKKPELKDNRFGFRLGGPVVRNRTFFFVNYDGRRFPYSTSISRVVPTDSLKQGVLRFRDAAGNINSYPLATSSACGPNGSDACDPRGLGISPTMAALWSRLPRGNDPSQGDGLNTIGYQGLASTPINGGFFHARIDHNLTNSWRLDLSTRYYREHSLDGSGQISILDGNVTALRQAPTRQNMDNVGLTGVIKPNFTAEFRFGRVRQRTSWDTLRPNDAATLLALPGTNTPAGYIGLDAGALGGTQSLLSEPIDLATQIARKKLWDGKVYQWNADLNWIKGRHTIQFGSHVRTLPTRQLSDDKGSTSLGALVAVLDSDLGAIRVPSAAQPTPCSASRTTNCLVGSDLQQWDRLYASALGLVDNIGVLAVRDGNLNPLPFGSVVESDTHGIWAPDFYIQDVWRIRPALTLTFGLNYGWQTPPKEKLGRYTMQTYADSGQLITGPAFLSAKLQAALQGQIYNPTLGFISVKNAGRDVTDIDWGNVGPRVGMAWNPSMSSGFLGRVFGDRKTVIRAGFSVMYDRQNTVETVLRPSLGVGFSQTITVTAPLCNAGGQVSAGCDPANANLALNGFRVGPDGVIPRPVVPPASAAFVPTVCTTGSLSCLFPEAVASELDPSIKNARNYGVDLTWQRELPKDMLLELGFAGRYARRLQQSVSLAQAPYVQLDPVSKQTFAQAFDNVATALRAGGTASPQPWFENLVPGGTSALVSAARSNFINGDVDSVFQALDLRRMAAGLPAFNNYQAKGIGLRSSIGYSNYNALLVTLRKRLSHGLIFDLNYTFSKSLDVIDTLQNSGGILTNGFYPDIEYGPSSFDLRHVFNGRWFYDLPFRTSVAPLNKVIGGWYLSGVFTAVSGHPLIVQESTQAFGASFLNGRPTGAIPTVNPSNFSGAVNRGSTGSGTVGVTGNPARGGTGLNLFADPQSVFQSFRPVLLSQDGRTGRGNPIRGLPFWNLDASLGKRVKVTERLEVLFSADFFNIFNKVNFADPSLALTSPGNFGVISSQFTPANRQNGSRAIQLALRVEF